MQEGSQGGLPELGDVFLPLLFCAYMSLMTKGHFMMASSNSLSERPFSSTDWPEHGGFFLISLRTKGLIFFS